MGNLTELGSKPTATGSPVSGDSKGRAGVRELPIQNGLNPDTFAVTVRDGTSSALYPTGGPTLIAAAANGERARILIYNNSKTQPIEIGPAGFAYGNGLPIAPGGSYAEADNQSGWYGLAPTGQSVDVRVLLLRYI